jgi:glucosamine--fructose-6-phosphate aminotransferase (isomerizing)
MCGIFATINSGTVTDNLIDGLKLLSYRGYDSAGLVVVNQHGLDRRRAKGKLNNLVKVIKNNPVNGMVGIAHNGIIENYQTLRNKLESVGYFFNSETDSEVIPHLITQHLDYEDDYETAVKKALSQLEGSFAVAIVFNDDPHTLIAARFGSPLIIGHSSSGYYLASDENSLSNKCHSVCHLEDGDTLAKSATVE